MKFRAVILAPTILEVEAPSLGTASQDVWRIARGMGKCDSFCDEGDYEPVVTELVQLDERDAKVA